MNTENKQLDTSDVLQEFYRIAPIEIQEVIDNDELFEKIHIIATGFQLDDADEEILKQEVLFILLGMQSLDAFRSNLEKQLEIDKLKFDNLSREIFDLFFEKNEKIIRENYLKVLKEEEQDRTGSSAPSNLPVAGPNQKIPVFSSATGTGNEQSMVYRGPNSLNQNRSEAQKPLVQPREKETLSSTKGEKPAYVPPDHVEPVRGMSQEDVFENRPKPKPYVTPTRDFKYRDEKIGGVNVEKNTGEEIEENIDRVELLHDIENPVKSEPTGGSVTRATYKGGDPYREHTE